MGSKERPKAEDARPIPPSVGMYHLGESWTGRSGRDQPTTEATIKIKEGRLPSGPPTLSTN